MKKTVDIAINLIPEDPFFETFIGRTMRWAVSVGRYIVIFTELVVIVSFGSRFVLDRQVTDLNESINQKETIIRSYGTLERDIRSIQARLNEYQQLQQRKNLTDIFPVLTRITPPDVRMETLNIQPGVVTLEGTSPSQASLNLLINNLQLSNAFTNISVRKIETSSDDQQSINFQIDARTEEVAPPAPVTPAAPAAEATTPEGI